jgi:NADH-quinone oxidoreductase subunit A
MDGWLGVVIMIVLGVGFAAVMIGLSVLLGPRNPTPEKLAFLYPWAVSLRDLGWSGFFQIVTFFLILLVGFVYVWRKGILDWGSRRVRTSTRKAA